MAAARRPVASPALAVFKDICIDANDATVLGRFWARVLDLKFASQRGGDAFLTGPTTQHRVWINTVPEPKTVKHRMHLDVRGDVAHIESLGARVVDASFPWTVMVDPEGGELCVFGEPIDGTRGALRNIVIDTADASRVAAWWGIVLDADVKFFDDHEAASVVEIPGAPFDSLDFVTVPEEKSVKNRLHIDVTCTSIDRLLDIGATLLRSPDNAISWHVLADIDGNEFCAFVVNR